MSLTVVLTRQAAADLDAAADWYETQAHLGSKFTSQVRDALVSIGDRPRTYQPIYRGIRRVTLRRFPYNIYFRSSAERVEVIAILHGRRNPLIWKKRI